MTFVYPAILFLIPVAWVFQIAMLLHARFWNKRKLSMFTEHPEVSKLVLHKSPIRTAIGELLFGLAVACLLFGLARPQWGKTVREVSTHGIDVIFALDASRSMLADDVKPNRLERAKFLIAGFSEQLKGGDRIGLVAFAGDAFLQCPLTLDYDAFRQSLDAVDTNIIARQGTDIASALSEVESAFKQSKNTKIAILLTDGEDLEEEGISKVKHIAQEGVKIYTIGIGSAEGAFIPVINATGKQSLLRDASGNIVRTKLDAGTLEKIAQSTGGFYMPFSTAEFELDKIYAEQLVLNNREKGNSETQEVGVDRFQLFLAIALGLLILDPAIKFTRRFRPVRIPYAAIAVCLIFAAFPDLRAQSLASNVTEANADGTKENTAFVDACEKADTAYRNKDYAVAEKYYSLALSEQAENGQVFYNLGNTCYRQGKFDEAKGHYESALKYSDPSIHARIFYNLGNTCYRQGETLFKTRPEMIPGLRTRYAEAKNNAEAALDYGRKAFNDTPKRKEAWQRCEAALTVAEALQKNAAEALVENTAVPDVWNQAHQHYLAAMDLDKHYAHAKENDAALLARIGNAPENYAFLKEAETKLKEWIDALKKMIEDLKKPTTDALALKKAMDDLVAQGRYKEAIELYQGMLPRDPTVENYEQYVQRIQQLGEIRK